MKAFDYTITDPEGIQARPAGMLVKEAGKFACKVTMTKDGKEVGAKKLFSVMGLGVKQGQTVTITVDGEDEEAAFSALETFFKENL